MTILHVGCLPFPTYQGTQAAIAAMVEASGELGLQPHLLTYAGRAYDVDAPYPLHRIPDRPRVDSLRSGPSWGKIALDLRMVAEVRRLVRTLRPHAIIAHHIEAAAATIAARVGPVHYVAHTALEPELPMYFATPLGRPAAAAGRALERFVCGRSSRVAAVAPALARAIPRSVYLPVPWPSALPTEPRGSARQALGIPEGTPVALYAGNLDRYQGAEDLVAALGILRRTRPNALLLVATASEPSPIVDRAMEAGLGEAILAVTLEGEASRRRAHAAGDFAWIPRRAPGGLPIKLLDALARGLPVVATDRATAGLSLGHACAMVANDDPHALAEGARRLLDDRALAARQATAGHDYLSREHDVATFGRAMSELTGMALPMATPEQPPSRAEGARRAP